MSSHYVKMCQKIAQEYRDAGMPWPASKQDIGEWAMTTGRWKLPTAAAVKICADDIARAMAEEYITDKEGRRVRAKHSATIKRNGANLTLWDDIRTATPTFMRVSVTQRRNQIVGECRQLKSDVDSFNALHPLSQPIQLVLDFARDVAELEALRAA